MGATVVGVGGLPTRRMSVRRGRCGDGGAFGGTDKSVLNAEAPGVVGAGRLRARTLVDRAGDRGHAGVVVGARGDSLRVAAAGLDDLGLRLDAADPGRALDALAGLEVLVDLEEVLDLQAVELAQVVDVAEVLQARIVGRDAEDLVVAALLVGHAEHADRAATDQAARERGGLDEYERVQWVLVLAERALDVAVVGRVLR